MYKIDLDQMERLQEIADDLRAAAKDGDATYPERAANYIEDILEEIES